ncbi:hypothetical protein DENSPDRAFT_785687 [Dentipellis sp. KUC8613]|nr:hypothetical protein DENSPDRAFT_785687 [Dentipellis sp. KUC8613]
MATLRPPSSPSPSPSPAPAGANSTPGNGTGKSANARASMGPAARPSAGAGAQAFNLASPRPGGGRPTSELLGSAGMFQTPEADAIDQWFENLQNYEVTLEEMAAASLDVNFKEELSAIEQWFKVLSEAERTAALYSLLQHSTQVQIRFFITVLQQMARSDPMTALLSPAAGGSMQAQMDAKLASMSLKSPGLKSPMPSSPSARNFSGGAPNRQSLAFESSGAGFLSPDTANSVGANPDAAHTLAQQRAKLKANNAAHRISAPALATGGDARGVWGSASSSLGQVAERSGSPTQEVTVPDVKGSRPQSTDFTGMAASAALRSPRAEGMDGLSPVVGDSWASMVNTPLIPMFKNNANGNNSGQNLDAAAAKLTEWSGSRVPLMDDPKKFRRVSKGTGGSDAGRGDDSKSQQQNNNNNNNGGHQQQQQRRQNGGFGGGGAGGNWNGARSPALSNVSSNRFGSEQDAMAGLQGMAGFNMGMGSPGLGMGLAGMGQLSPFNMNMNMLNMANLSAMGISPEAQLLAAQMAAGGFGQPGMFMGMQPPQHSGPRSTRSGYSGRSPAKSQSGRGDGSKRGDEEEFDPALLTDIPAWLRSLRLHKYTPNFETMNWRDMVVMDEAALEAKGVAALGARRKMLKTFEIVRKKMNIDGPEGAPPQTA